jgi:hypothetical protein
VKWLRTLAVAYAALSLTAGTAQALSTDWGVHDAVELGAGLFDSPGPIDETYTFTLLSGPLTLTAVSNDAAPTFDISGGLVELFASGGSLIGSLPFDSTAVHTTFDVAPGDYYYHVTGEVTGSAGSYLISSAIPEPTPALLLLAGLAGIAIVRRRRS